MTWIVRRVIPQVLVVAMFCMICAGFLATPAYAFDGEWPGFLLGASVGAGVTSGVEGQGANRDNSFAGSTGIRFGYGFDRFAVFLMTHMTWSKYNSGAYDNYITATRGDHGFYGLSVAYRTRSQRPFFYPLVGVGRTTWGDPPVHPESEFNSAWGLLVGAGMEPWKHVSFELIGYKGVIAEHDYNYDSTHFAATHSWTIQLAVTVMAY